MKYLKYFKNDVDYQNYVSSDDFVMPNVSYSEDTDMVYCNPIKSKNSTIYATYLATDDNKLAIANTSNVKSLKVNGNNVSFNGDYYFESNGEYEVEIELIDDSVINGIIFDENGYPLSSSIFCSVETGNGIGSCLTSITIPDSVTSIGDYAFYSCYSLTSITIPNSVTSIGNYAFRGCEVLTSVNIPDSVDYISEGAFAQCLKLTSINIPNSVTSIGDFAFADCYDLKSINIPNSVTSIGNYVFDGCYMLNEITCLATTAPNINSETFNNIRQNGILKYPAGSDYSSWMRTDEFYLGKYNWTAQEI